MPKDLKTEFWDRLDDVQAGMLAADGQHPVPMAPHADADHNAIWFITSDETDLARASVGGTSATLQLADPKANIFATVDGFMRIENNQAKLDELWNAVTAAWFEGGRDDPSIRLVKMVPSEAEVWATTGPASFIYEIAKARVTDHMPDVGQHGTVRFHE